MKYTTPEHIYRKIKTRLDVDVASFGGVPSTLFPGVADSATKMPVDPELVEDIAEEIEGWLDLLLMQLYEFPLQSEEHSTLRSIVTNLTVAELLRNYFQGIGLATLSSDISSYSTDLVNKAYYNIHCLTAGTNIPVPSILGYIQIPPTEDFFKRNPTPLILAGEIPLKSKRRPALVSRVDTIIGKKGYEDGVVTDVNKQYGISWDIGTNRF